MKHSLSLKKSSSRIISIILLALILIVISKAHLDIHNGDAFNQNSNSSQWQQPIDLHQQYPTLISKHTWTLEFTEIEKIINSLELSPSQKILINSYTADKLQGITSQLNSESSNIEWYRLELLIKKSLGNDNGDLLTSLVKAYYFYQKDRTVHLNSINNSDPRERLSLLKDSSGTLFNIQSNHFGSHIATRLFKRKNTTTNYLNHRKIVHLDNRLNNIEKKEKLLLLSNNYKQSISQW